MKISSAVAYLITIGLISILGQVVILRELSVAFYGIELIYVLSLGFWLLGTAIGASVGRRSHIPGERSIQTLLILMSAALLIDIIFIRDIRRIFGGVSGGYLPFDVQIAGLMAAIIPLSLLTGLLFQAAAKRFLSEGGTLARAYAIESTGGVLGGLLSTLLLALGLQNLSAGLVCSVWSLGIVSFYSWRARLRVQKYLSIIGVAFLVVLVTVEGRIDGWTTMWNHPDMVESNDTPYGRITVTAQEEQVCVFENDALSYETETTEAEEFVQLSALQTNKLDRVLVLGGGFEGIVSELLKLPVRGIDYVEINKGIMETVLNHLPAELRNSLYDERVKIFYQDPRRFHGFSYNVILVMMPEPMSAQNNRFYTREFFEQCSAELQRGGILAFRIPSAENLWTPQLQNRNGSIYCALKSVFPHVVVIPGVTNIFIASDSELTTDPRVLSDRLRVRNIQNKLVTPEYVNYVYTNDRFREVERLLSTAASIPNSDIQPACYGYTLSIWLSKFLGEFALPDVRSFQIAGLLRSPILWFAILAALIVAVRKELVAARLFIIMAVTGFAGMISETLLILNYQSKSGVLYQDIGILLMTFMAGLTLGASVADNSLRKWGSDMKKRRLLGASLLLGLGTVSIIVYYAIKLESLNNLLPTSLILILDGAFVSAIFAFASFKRINGPQKIMTWLYSADLIGGCIGSLTVSLMLIPVFGILTTSLLTAVVAVCALAFLR
jgi:spermidine synthase